MKIEVQLLENSQNVATYNGYEIFSDAPKSKGGGEKFPEPFDYFIISIGLCAAHFVKKFCQTRNINFSNIRLTVTFLKTDLGQPKIKTSVILPQEFPCKYQNALISTIDSCTVKKIIKECPEFTVEIDKTNE